jgi:trk system potassium uptake protein TrkH
MSTRSGGLHQTDFSALSSFSLIIIGLVMLIGGAPASTAGGIKVTPVYTVYKSFACVVTKNKPMASQKFIAEKYQIQAFAILIFCLLVCLFGVLGCSLFNPEADIFSVLFDVLSAFSNNGLSLGFIYSAAIGSKFVIIILMFLGRLGILTCLHLLNFRKKEKGGNIKYVEGEYILG